MDGDGDLDLLVPNESAPDRLHLNDGTGTFSDATLDPHALQHALLMGGAQGTTTTCPATTEWYYR